MTGRNNRELDEITIAVNRDPVVREYFTGVGLGINEIVVDLARLTQAEVDEKTRNSPAFYNEIPIVYRAGNPGTILI